MEALELEKKRETQEKETKAPKRVFIEVGTSRVPVSIFGSRELGQNETYLGIDISKKSVVAAKRGVERHFGKNESVNFIQADAAELPMKDNSADELFLGNVLGDPGIKLDKKMKFIREAGRILKVDGMLIIKETNTPIGYGDLSKLLKGSGFAPEKFLTPKDAEWDEEIVKYQKLAVGTEGHWPIFLAYLRNKKSGKK